jgi:hypothetical protein
VADGREKVKGLGHSEYCDVNGRKGLKKASGKVGMSLWEGLVNYC